MGCLTGTKSMRTALLAVRVSLTGSAVCGLWVLPSVVVSAEDSAKDAATVETAAKVLDLSTLALAEGAKVPFGRYLGTVTYEVDSDSKTAFQFHQKQLTELGWKELPGAASQAEYISATFQKSGFVLSVASYASSDPTKPKSATVSINNLGNVRLSKLPSVKGAKQVFASDVTATYSTTLKPAEAVAATRKLLSEAGWEPYGSISNPPDSEVMTFKRNAVRLTAFVGVSPTQPNEVMISYNASVMAADIPAPTNAKEVGFDDAEKTLRFQSPDTFDDVAKFYQQRLAKMGWKPTTDELTKTKFGDDRSLATLMFRNGVKDVLSLDLTTDEGKTHAKLKHLTAAEIAAAEKSQRAAAEKLVAKNKALEEEAEAKPATKPTSKKAAAESDDGLPDVDALIKGAVEDALKDAGLGGKARAKGTAKDKAADKDAVSVPIPEGAKKVTQTSGNVLQIKWPAGKGKASAETLRDQLLAAGWEMDEDDKIEKNSGNVTFTKDGKTLTMSFVDTGISDVNMMLIGIGVKLAEGKADPDAKVAAKPEKKSDKPDTKPSKPTAKKTPKSDDDSPAADPARPEKAKKGIAKLPKLPSEGKVIVEDEPIALPHVLAYETVSGGHWVTRIVATEKPIRQASWIERLKNPGEVDDNSLDTPNLRLELDDKDQPNRMNCVAKNTPGGTTSNIEGEAIVEDGRARGSFKMTKPETFFGRTIIGEITFDVPVLTRDSQPAKLLADAPKLETSGKLLVDGKPIKLGSVVAYEVTVFDEKRTAIFFTEKPINMTKLKASLAKSGTDDSIFEVQSQVKVVIDKDDKLSMMNLWHDNASLNSNSDLIGDVVVEDGRARGTAKLGKATEFFGKTFSFELTFDVEVLKLPATEKE